MKVLACGLLSAMGSIASAEVLPTAFLPLMQACVQSGGQVGFRLPTGLTGDQNYPLFSPSIVDTRRITVNVWGDQPSVISVQINMLPSQGTSIKQMVTTNSSLTVYAKLATLLVAAGNNTVVWCTHVES